jgi:hypothetical protein
MILTALMLVAVALDVQQAIDLTTGVGCSQQSASVEVACPAKMRLLGSL